MPPKAPCVTAKFAAAVPRIAQKASIAEVRNFYEAKLAEAEVLHQSKLRAIFDPAAREVLAQEYRRDRERLASERDGKIEKIRRA